MNVNVTPSDAALPADPVQVPRDSSAITESKHEKFLRLASARVNRALEDIRLIGQLSARSYEHWPSEAELVVDTIANATFEMSRAFSVPFAFKVGKAGQVDTAIDIFNEAKAGAPAETDKIKIAVAKALDAISNGDDDAAREILVDLL